eukprot:7218313-Alexandrium_andersonii.AAC.1
MLLQQGDQRGMESHGAVHLHRRRARDKGSREMRFLRPGNTAARTKGNGHAEEAAIGQALR